MTGELTTKIVRKAHVAIQGIHRTYMVFTSNMECLRIVLNPETLKSITQEFWEEEQQRGMGVHQGFWVQDAYFEDPDKRMEFDNRMLGIRVITDKKVPEGEVEIRAVLNKSWEPVL